MTIRVLVIDDSLTVRRRLCEVLASDPEIEVVGDAGDGKSAIELCAELRPHVISLDMMLPVMTGLAATEHIMAYFPTPILVVSASTNRGELFETYQALAAGAVDVLEKPRGDEPDGRWEKNFIAALKMVSRIKVITHPRGRLGASIADPRSVAARMTPATAASRASSRLLVIGASTGGPSALLAILRSLPPELALPMLVVLHLPEAFSRAFADWLGGLVPFAVSFARDGEPIPPAGHVVLAPPGKHLEAVAGHLRLTSGPERHSCRPSVDVLFESVARERAPTSIACLLTGMGRDGAEGLLSIKRAGGTTIAQDEASSVVYGMPRAAALLGAADHVLPLDAIAPALTRLASGLGRQR